MPTKVICEVCENCKGKGFVPVRDWDKNSTCVGNGEILYYEVCPICFGTGKGENMRFCEEKDGGEQ